METDQAEERRKHRRLAAPAPSDSPLFDFVSFVFFVSLWFTSLRYLSAGPLR
jgi:hypothetical protein